jgi:hypothetical protein
VNVFNTQSRTDGLPYSWLGTQLRKVDLKNMKMSQTWADFLARPKQRARTKERLCDLEWICKEGSKMPS